MRVTLTVFLWFCYWKFVTENFPLWYHTLDHQYSKRGSWGMIHHSNHKLSSSVPHPEPPFPSLPVPSLWVIPVHQPQASFILLEPGLAICFLYDIIHVSVPFSQITHPRPLPQSPKDYSIHLCLFCCLPCRVIVAIFLNSIYMRYYTVLVFFLLDYFTLLQFHSPH